MLIDYLDNQTSSIAQTTARVRITKENNWTIDLEPELMRRQTIKCDGIVSHPEILILECEPFFPQET
jgi:hypothetical protein